MWRSCDGHVTMFSMFKKRSTLKITSMTFVSLNFYQSKKGFRANFRLLCSKNLNLDTWRLSFTNSLLRYDTVGKKPTQFKNILEWVTGCLNRKKIYFESCFSIIFTLLKQITFDHVTVSTCCKFTFWWCHE